MKRNALALMGCMMMLCGCAPRTGGLEEAFLNPPQSAALGCYYYWDNGNISKEGITKDLEAMKAVGIESPYVSSILGGSAPDGPVKILSEEWWDCMVHTAVEAKRLGMRIGYFNCPGWSQSGGPWVKPEQTMRYLFSRERVFRCEKEGEDVNIALSEMDFPENFQLVKAQAFPRPQCDDDSISGKIAKITADGIDRAELLFDGDSLTAASSPSTLVRIGLKLSAVDTIRSLRLYPASRKMLGTCVLESLGEDGLWKVIDTVEIDRPNLATSVGPMVLGPLYVGFPAVTSDEFRLTFATADGLSFKEINLSGAPVVTYCTEKQLGKMFPRPDVQADSYEWPETVEPGRSALAVNPKEVVDLTDFFVDGQLRWKAPKGDWVVLVTGMVPTGMHNSPCPPEAVGLEIDKMNRSIAAEHFDTFIGELLDRIPQDCRDAVKYVVADSYEMGSQNWTDDFAQSFSEVYGYDPYPYLPVLTGRIVGDAKQSERFLWDMRRLVADRISSEYIGGLREKAHERGLTLWLENYGHWGYPGEFLSYGGASDEVSGEYWIDGLGAVEVRCASSAAHIYGKPRVSCESFTSNINFRLMPSDLKRRGDWAMSQGINHYIMHVYLHQSDDRKPGITAWFGTDFNRNNTWFSKSSSYMDYIRRSCALLQRGRSVADIAYFIGENTPKMTGEVNPALPEGYDYDFVNAEVLLKAKVGRDGRIVLPSGASYALLVLPSDRTMRPETAQKLVSLLKAGAHIMGNAPTASPSLKNYPDCDEQVASCAQAMTSLGLIAPCEDLGSVMESLGYGPDITLAPDMLFTHRCEEGSHIYFVSNQLTTARTVELSFRVDSLEPELWDAVDCSMRPASTWRMEGGRTYVTVDLDSAGSVFVVFRNKTSETSASPEKAACETLASLEGPWSVSFVPMVGESFSRELSELSDWTLSEDKAVKYFSGSATYKAKFSCSASEGKKVTIDLGRVHGIALVKVNGETFSGLWTPPYRTDISEAIKDGENEVEIEVTNPWLNRLVGDCQEGAQKVTWTTAISFDASTPLLPSGLIGPVKVVSNGE